MRERIMNVMKKKEDNKGFTLVELIVVIVILAILAAILVPGLLKWIDKAKEEQYVLEARNIYLAAEAQIAEEYAKNSATAPNKTTISDGATFKSLADDSTAAVEGIKYDTTDKFKVAQITVKFTSSNASVIIATMDPNKTWTINSIDGTEKVAPPTYS